MRPSFIHRMTASRTGRQISPKTINATRGLTMMAIAHVSTALTISLLAGCQTAPERPSAYVEASCPAALTDAERVAFYGMCRHAALNEHRTSRGKPADIAALGR